MSSVDVLGILDDAALGRKVGPAAAQARAAVAELMEVGAAALACMDAGHDWQATADELRAALAACGVAK